MYTARITTTIVYVFIDFANAAENIHRDSLRKMLPSYGIPQHLIDIIERNFMSTPDEELDTPTSSLLLNRNPSRLCNVINNLYHSH